LNDNESLNKQPLLISMLSRGLKRKILLSVLLTLAFSVEFAVAADVAYVYRNERKIDENVLDVFDEMSLSVKLIDEKNLPSSLSAYRFIFIGNERISNAKKIPVGEVPAILMNKYYGQIYGLTNRNGIGMFASSAPLRIDYGGKKVKAYNFAYDERKVSVPYYFISEKSKTASSVEQIIALRASEEISKDVVSYVSPGAILENRKAAKKEICFFGLVASDYWTASARKIFKDCVGFVLSDSAVCSKNSDCDDDNPLTVDECINPGTASAMCRSSITDFCSSKEDCGTDGYVGGGFCFEGNVAKKFRSYVCNNPGTSQSSCSSSDENAVIDDCISSCAGGVCTQQSELIHDVALVNATNAIGKIRIQTSNGEEILLGDSLQCNEKYKVIVRVKNLGNYTENVTFSGGAGNMIIEHGDIADLEPAKTSDRTKTVNFTLTEGRYNLTIEAILDKFSDVSLSDNIARREINVVCGGAPASCSSDGDCGTDGLAGNSFCAGGNVVRNYKTFSCNNAGTSDSSCSSSEEETLVQTCTSGCSNGACVSSSGLVHDVALVNVTNTAGAIRIKDSITGADILSGILQCNKKYQIIVRAKNLGNYTESVMFSGTLGALDMDHGSVSALESGKTSDRTKTMNITLAAGNYAMTIGATLNGTVDANLANNVVTKQVVVSC